MIKHCLKIGFLLISIGESPNLLAHDILNSLGPVSSASDYYQIQCFNDNGGSGDPSRLEVTLISFSKSGPVISLQVRTENPLQVSNITDAIGGDKMTSRTESIAIENGGFAYFTVNKAKAGIQKYQIKFHCLSATGHAGTAQVTLQNQ